MMDNAHPSPRLALLLLLAVQLCLTGCATRNPAPVVDRRGDSSPTPVVGVTAASSRPAFHDVQKGETLFSVAFQHGIDYRELARWNALTDPNLLRIGQRLRLGADTADDTIGYVGDDNASAGKASGNNATVTTIDAASGIVVTPLGGDEPVKPAVAAPLTVTPANARGAATTDSLKSEPKAIKQPYSDKTLALLQNAPPVPPVPYVKPAPNDKPLANVKPAPNTKRPEEGIVEEGIAWIWPTRGKARAAFSEASKGIDIGGARGQPVAAAAAGKVIHVGGNLRGYGKLIIIQHNSMFLSAYAHNQQILVKEGERVSSGQKIAEMGDSDTDQVKLHFEIRRFGKPVDPLQYLPAEKAS